MKVKVVASVLAGVMSVQNVAIAASRVDGIGTTQIAAAQNEVEFLRTALKGVEASLLESRAQVQMALDDKESGAAMTFNVIHLGSAGLGLALGALSAVIATDARGAGVAQLIMGTLGAGLTTVSAATGLIKDGTTTKPQLSEAKKQLLKSTQDVEALMLATQDAELKRQLVLLSDGLINLSSSLNGFAQQETNKKRFKIGYELTQVAGVALAMTVLLNKNNLGGRTQELLLISSAVAQSVGNTMSMLYLASEDQYEAILEKIDGNLKFLSFTQEGLK